MSIMPSDTISFNNLKQTSGKKQIIIHTNRGYGMTILMFQASGICDIASADVYSACMSTGSVEDQGSTSVPTVICRRGSLEEAPQAHGSGIGSMLLAQNRRQIQLQEG